MKSNLSFFQPSLVHVIEFAGAVVRHPNISLLYSSKRRVSRRNCLLYYNVRHVASYILAAKLVISQQTCFYLRLKTVSIFAQKEQKNFEHGLFSELQRLTAPPLPRDMDLPLVRLRTGGEFWATDRTDFYGLLQPSWIYRGGPLRRSVFGQRTERTFTDFYNPAGFAAADRSGGLQIRPSGESRWPVANYALTLHFVPFDSKRKKYETSLLALFNISS